jgi:hypothetical protein
LPPNLPLNFLIGIPRFQFRRLLFPFRVAQQKLAIPESN